MSQTRKVRFSRLLHDILGEEDLDEMREHRAQDEPQPIADPAEASLLPSGMLASFPLPAQLGPYLLLQVLGEGGMGVVYLAQQQEPV